MKKILTILVSCIVLAACTDQTITYIHPDITDPTESEPTLAIASENPLYTATDPLNGAVQFKSRGGELTIRVKTNQKSWSFTRQTAAWLEATQNELDDLCIKVAENTSDTPRSTVLTIRTGEGGASAPEAKVTVAQNAYGTLEISASKTEVEIPAKGETTVELEIDCGTDQWTFDCPCDWILVRRTADDKLRIAVDDNTRTEARTMDVKLIAGSGKNIVTETVRVAQQGAVYVTPSPSALSFNAAGGQNIVQIESNYDWDFENNSDWLTVIRRDNTLTISAPAYRSDQNRHGSVVVTAGDGKQNTTTYQIGAVQLGESLSQMIFVFDVPSNNTEITLPLAGTLDCSVNWGDTNVEAVTKAAPKHTYAFAGQYTVTIDGTATALTSSALKYLTEVKQWGQTGLTSMEKAFYNCTSLKSIPGDSYGSFAGVTTFSMTFYGCTGIAEIPAGLFDAAVGNTTFSGTFRGMTAIKQIPAGLFDRNKAVTIFTNVFYGCTGITAIPAGLFDNCAEVTMLDSAFSNTSIENIPAGLLDKLTKLTNINSLFSSSPKVAAIPAGLLDNCPEITTMNGTFRGTAITQIPADLFVNNTKCNNMGYIFTLCPNLKIIPAGLFAPLIECTRFDYAFQGCAALEEVPDYLLSGFTKCTTYGSAFADCKALKSVPENLFANASSPSSISFLKTFMNCTSLTEIPTRLFATAAATTFESTFQGSGLVNLPAGLFENSGAVTTFANTFQNCKQLESVPSKLFRGATKANSFAYVFDGCAALKNVPGDIFTGCAAVTTATYLFRNCTSLTTVNEGLFDAFAKVSTYAYTFYGCKALATVPVNLFDNSREITTASYLFYDCQALTGESPYTEIDGVKYHLYERTTGNFTKAISTRTKCFYNCTGLDDYSVIPSTWR